VAHSRFLLLTALSTVVVLLAGCSNHMPREMTVHQVAVDFKDENADHMRGAPPLLASSKITTYEECVAAGNTTTRSLPPRCITPEGQTFIGGGLPGTAGAEEFGNLNIPGSPWGEIRSFEDCVAAGYAIRRSLPPSCTDSGGRLFTEGSDEIGLVPPDELPSGARFCKDLCGDGMCQEIVCMAVGCPCAESPQTCPRDCAP
jgi:hypothetical protein